MAPQARTCDFTYLNHRLSTALEKDGPAQVAETRENSSRSETSGRFSGELAWNGCDIADVIADIGWEGGYFMEMSPLRGVSDCKGGVYSVFLGRCDRRLSHFVQGTRNYGEKGRRNAKTKGQGVVGTHR